VQVGGSAWPGMAGGLMVILRHRETDRDRARSLMRSSSLRAAARKAISASGIAFAFFLPCSESASPLLQQAWGLREMKSV